MFVSGARTMKISMLAGVWIIADNKQMDTEPAKFNEQLYKKSALSYHMFHDHPEKARFKLKNYDLGILKSTSSVNLYRLEDYYINITHAKLPLNRYKTTQ